MNRKLYFLGFALALAYALLGVPVIESLLDDEIADNDQVVVCVNEVVPRVTEIAESTRNKLPFVEESSPFSLSPLFVPPSKAGQDLLHLLTQQKK